MSVGCSKQLCRRMCRVQSLRESLKHPSSFTAAELQASIDRLLLTCRKEQRTGEFTHIVRNSETGVVLNYCASERQAKASAVGFNRDTFHGEDIAVVEPNDEAEERSKTK